MVVKSIDYYESMTLTHIMSRPLTNIELFDVTFLPSKFLIKEDAGNGGIPLQISELKPYKTFLFALNY